MQLRRRLMAEAPVKPRLMAPLNFKQFFDDWIEDNKKQWAHDRSKTLGGSEVFGCIRKAWYSRNGTPKDADYEDRWGATKRGDLIENYLVVPTMDHASNKHGFTIQYHGDDQVTLFADGVPMSVTPDGLIKGLPSDALSLYGIPDIGSDCVMLEIKSIDPRVDLSEEKAIHHGQTQIQMGLVRENTDFRPNYAVILYINASFLDDIEVFVVPFDPKKYETAKSRSKMVYETKDPNELMREGRIDGSCQYCPFQGACLQTTQKGMPAKTAKSKRGDEETDPALLDALNDLIAEARLAGIAVKKATKQHEYLKEQVRQTLRDFGKNRAKGEGWTVSYSMASGKKSLDREALENKFGEVNQVLAEAGVNWSLNIEDFMKEGNPYEILRTTFKDPTQDEI